MAETPQDESGDQESKEASPGVGKFLYRLALAGVGGVVLAQEELTGLFQKRVAGDASEASSEGEAEPSESIEETRSSSAMEATIDGVLHTLNLPTRGDVVELTEKIDELAARVESLREP